MTIELTKVSYLLQNKLHQTLNIITWKIKLYSRSIIQLRQSFQISFTDSDI